MTLDTAAGAGSPDDLSLRSLARIYLVVGLLGALLCGGLAWRGLPCGTSDDAFYKSPSAEWVQHGRLAIPCVADYVPRSEEVFACYPPVYEVLLAAWYRLAGFSLYTTLTFTIVVHLLGALAVMETTRRLLVREPAIRGRRALIAAVGLAHTADLAYFDRLEELGLLFVWAEMLLADGRPAGPGAKADWFRTLAQGVLLGLAALTAPWTGLLGATVVTVRHLAGLPWRAAAVQTAIVGAVSATLFAGWAAFTEARHPGVLRAQFLGVMQNIRDDQGPFILAKNAGEFGHMLLYNETQLPILAVTLALFPFVLASGEQRARHAGAVGLFTAGVLGTLLLFYGRPIAYTYFGAVLMLMLPCFPLAVGRYLRGEPAEARFGMGIVGLLAAVALVPAAKLSVRAVRLPPEERFESAAARILQQIPAGEPVAVKGRYWYVVQGRNPWHEAYFATLDHPDALLESQWLILEPGVGTPVRIDAFEKVEETTTTGDGKQTYGYSLWKKRQSR